MKLQLFVASLLVGMATAGQLSNKYLPPSYAGSSGGHANLLQSPRASGRPSNQYLAPHGTPHYHGVSGAAHSGQFAAAASSPAASHYGHNAAAAQIPVLRNDYTNDGSGNYNFGFETGNGIRRDETGELKGEWPHASLNVMGSYSYTGDDGRVYTVNYKADGNGFHAEGDHLPTPPPIPPEIQESLALHQSSHASGQNYGQQPAGGGHYGGHIGAASAHAPSNRYLPPAAHRHYVKRHY